jgi:hypothetical protein
VGCGGIGFGSEKGLKSIVQTMKSLDGAYGGGGIGVRGGGGGGGGWSGGGVGINGGGGGGSFVGDGAVNVVRTKPAYPQLKPSNTPMISKKKQRSRSVSDSTVQHGFHAPELGGSNGVVTLTLLEDKHPNATKMNYLENEEDANSDDGLSGRSGNSSSTGLMKPSSALTSLNLLKVVAAPRWEPDDEVSSCPCCKEGFGWTTLLLKHHCRWCTHILVLCFVLFVHFSLSFVC